MSAKLVKVILEAEWDLYKEEIESLYLTNNRKLEGPGGVIDLMAARYGFCRSKTQYERKFRKWGFRKNRKGEDWKAIGKKVERRKLEGKDSEVYINDELILPSRVSKEVRRQGFVSTLEKYIREPSPQIPQGVRICTPRAVTPITTDWTSNLPFYQLESNLFPQGMCLDPSCIVSECLTDDNMANYMVSPSPSQECHPTRPGSLLPFDRDVSALTFEASSEASSLLDILHPDLPMQAAEVNEIMPDLESLSAMFKALLLGPSMECSLEEQATTMTTHDQSKSTITKLILFSIANNFAGFENFPMKMVLQFLKFETDARILQCLQYTRGPESEAFAEILFRASIEAEEAHIVKALLDTGLDPNRLVCTFKGRRCTPIERSSQLQNVEITKLLLLANADVNKTLARPFDVNEKGALQYAIGMYPPSRRRTDINLIRMLLEANAEVSWEILDSAVSCPQDVQVMKLLIQFCGKIDDSGGSEQKFVEETRFLKIAIEKFDTESALEVLQVFLQGGSAAYYNSAPDYHNPLSAALDLAAKLGRAKIVQFLISCGTHISSSTLSMAVKSTNKDLVHFLLDYGADIDEPGDHGTTPLAEAIRSKDVELFEIFVSKGAWDHIEQIPRLTAALEAAAEVGNISVIRSLLSISSEARGEDLSKALNLAMSAEHEEIAMMLLDAGADVNSSRSDMFGKDFEKLISLALRLKNSTLVGLILEADVVFLDNDVSALRAAVEWGDYSIVESLIAYGANVRDPRPLIYAVEARNLKLTELLVNNGADVNRPGISRSHGNTTALEAAVRNGDLHILRYLICHGADPNRSKALEAAVRNGDLHILGYLLCHGADPNDSGALFTAISSCVELLDPLLTGFTESYPHGKKEYGTKALGYAIQDGNLPLIEKLLACKINPNEFFHEFVPPLTPPVRNLTTSLGFAIAQDQGTNLTLVEKLLIAGGNPNSIARRQDNGHPSPETYYTALLVAIKTRSAAMVRLLISFGADVNRPANVRVKRTPLQQAAEIGSYDIVQMLLDEGALVNAEPAVRGGATALQLAAIGGYIGIAELLLKRGAMVNAPPSKVNGRTALEGAAEHGRIDMLKLLLNAGAEIDGPGRRQYERARQLAEENGHIATRNYIESFSSTSSSVI